ncbi:uncharacterized protein LOC130809967 isoform X1 [Amaranthus tricolor]|uniref:uncharacterized protein LOC130809967 isoform X1 n=2 Tax=Amaranthus tricolor TaxID=29722 RepID=UPI00258C3152|nr:uncharacterized protein LOC130809967 isoform X1 [Amaranthus tricolor]
MLLCRSLSASPFFLGRIIGSTLKFLNSPCHNLHSGFIGCLEKMGDEQQVTKVLFCGQQFIASYLYTKEYLSQYSHVQVDDVPLSDVPKIIGNYHMIIPRMMRLDSNIISYAKQMKLILQFGVGLEGVDVDAATKHGIRVARIPADGTGNASSCAEMAIYLILGLLRKQKEMEISIKRKKLGEPAGETLFGKTVFILGFGNIGCELAKRLKPFDVKILATKRSWASHQQNGSLGANDSVADLVDEKGSHNDIYKYASMADIVVCCLNMNRETAGIVNHTFIQSMKKGAYLINIARGGLLDYGAVAQNLKSGYLGGLGIDVAWTEPFDPNDPILQLPNVLITPHVAGVTEYSYRSMAKVVGDAALQLSDLSTIAGIQFVN